MNTHDTVNSVDTLDTLDTVMQGKRIQCIPVSTYPACCGGASLPLPIRTCAQARARVLVTRLDCYGRLPYLVACLRALVAGAWLLLAKGRAEGTSARTRADARLRTHAHENPPSAPREATHVR